MPHTHEVAIIDRDTDKTVKSFKAASERQAEKLERGIEMNLDHRRYYVDVRPRSAAK